MVVLVADGDQFQQGAQEQLHNQSVRQVLDVALAARRARLRAQQSNAK